MSADLKLIMLLGTFGASLLGKLLTGKGIVRAGTGNKKGKGIVRAGTGKQWGFLMPPRGTHWIALFCNRNWNCLFQWFWCWTYS